MNLLTALMGLVAGSTQGGTRTLADLPGLRLFSRGRLRHGMERIPRERRRGMPRRAYRYGVLGGLRLKDDRRRLVKKINKVKWIYGQA